MQVQGIGPTAITTAATSDRTTELGQDAFMKLLLTQLKYQDPFEAMNDRDFMAQLAQFSSLSELQKLNETLAQFTGAQSLSDAASLIGKTITGADSSGSPVTGVAEAALLREGQVYLRVSGTELPLTKVQEVVLSG